MLGGGAEVGAAATTPSTCGLGVVITSQPTSFTTGPSAAASLGALDELGCAGIWFADHLFWQSPMLECFTMCAVAAVATTRCTIGTGVLQLPLRRPAVVAKTAATLQHLTAGRFVLGVGVGEHEEEYRRTGASYGHRGRDLDAGISALRGLWAASDDRFAQRPVPTPIPIWIGGRSDAAMARAVALGDGWLSLFLTPDALRSRLDRMGVLAAQRGRLAAPTAAIVVPTAITAAGRTRRDALARLGEVYGVDAQRFDRYLVSGSAEHCARQLVAYREAGAQQIVVMPAGDDPVGDVAAMLPPFLSA